MTAPVIALDIGGTYTRVGATRFATSADYRAEVEALAAVVRPLAPGSVGVSFGGRMTRDGDRVAAALNLPDYSGRPLRADLAAAFGCPVRVAHDATCGLLGERHDGALRGYDRCAYITLSTGTGAAIRLGGPDGGVVLTTEVGHQIVPGNDRRCLCGQRGCLDTLTGGNQIERHTGTPPAAIDDEDFWTAYARSLALGLANTALTTGVDAVALGGGIILNRPSLWPALAAELAAVLTYQPLAVVPARLGDTGPRSGAARLFTTSDDLLH
jgi:glucokinase